MSEKGSSDKERLWMTSFSIDFESIQNLPFNFRVIACRIRLFPRLISKIKWPGLYFFREFLPLCPQEHWYYNYSWYWRDTSLDNLVKLLLFLYNFLQMTIIQYYCPGTLYRVLLGQKYYSLKNRLFYSMSEACCWLVAGKCWIQTCECPYYMR